MRFEVVHGLDFAIRRNQATDGATLGNGGVYLQNRTPRKHGYKHRGCDDSNREPTEPPARRWVRIVVRSQPFVFQNAAGPIASNNLSFRSAVKTQATVTHGAWLD